MTAFFFVFRQRVNATGLPFFIRTKVFLSLSFISENLTAMETSPSRKTIAALSHSSIRARMCGWGLASWAQDRRRLKGHPSNLQAIQNFHLE